MDYQEYVGSNSKGEINRMLKSKPKTMLRKVALMQALREAFPIALGGLYEETELDQRTEAKIIEADSTEKVKTTYIGNAAEKKEIAEIDELGETEVKEEPTVLSEEEAQKEQAELLDIEKDKPEVGRNQLNIRWHTLVKKLKDINYFSDDKSYREWLKETFGIDSSKEFTDKQMSSGIGKLAELYNKHSRKEK